MLTMFNSNLRQALAFSLLVYFLTRQHKFFAYLTAVASHGSVFVIIAAIALLKKIVAFALIIFIFTILNLIAFHDGYLWMEVLVTKVEKRITFTNIQDFGYLVHLAFILFIYLLMNGDRHFKVKKSALMLSSFIFLMLLSLIFVNNVPQRITFFVCCYQYSASPLLS